MKFRPLHDRVVVKLIEAEEKSAGGVTPAAKFYETELMPTLFVPLWTWPPHVVELRPVGTENISK
jgi:hypothetical protein